jgi:hypothetical protein
MERMMTKAKKLKEMFRGRPLTPEELKTITGGHGGGQDGHGEFEVFRIKPRRRGRALP